MVQERVSVSAEQAAEICGCSIKEVEEYRRNVLPRPPGVVPDPARFSAREVAAIAAGVNLRSWPCRRTALRFVARLALDPSYDRDSLVVYQPQRPLRVEAAGFVYRFKNANSKAGRIFDPAPFFDAYDKVVADNNATDSVAQSPVAGHSARSTRTARFPV
jgi:hypothetical protein